jgi:hypothetical protein
MPMRETAVSLPAGLTLPISWAGRQWAVTGYGIERVDGHRYEIEADRIGETRRHSKDGLFCDWHVHLAAKAIDVEDFIEAYRFARKKWSRHAVAITAEVLERSEEEARNIALHQEIMRPILREVEAEMFPERVGFMYFRPHEGEAVVAAARARALAEYGELPPRRFL